MDAEYFDFRLFHEYSVTMFSTVSIAANPLGLALLLTLRAG